MRRIFYSNICEIYEKKSALFPNTTTTTTAAAIVRFNSAINTTELIFMEFILYFQAHCVLACDSSPFVRIGKNIFHTEKKNATQI